MWQKVRSAFTEARNVSLCFHLSASPSAPSHTFQPPHQPVQRAPRQFCQVGKCLRYKWLVERKKNQSGGLLFKLLESKGCGFMSKLPVGSQAHFKNFYQLICDVCAPFFVNKPFQYAYTTCPLTNAGKPGILTHSHDQNHAQNLSFSPDFSFPTSRPCLPHGVQILLQKLLGGNGFSFFFFVSALVALFS